LLELDLAYYVLRASFWIMCC